MELEISDLRNRILLSQKFWYFRYGLHQDEEEIDEDPGLKEEWYRNGIPKGAAKLKVYVPTTWSLYKNQKHFYHFGTGWYQTSFYLPEKWGSGDGKKVTLVFNGVNYKTEVWLNGEKIGFHEGGYTKFWFEINNYLKFGSENLLVVRVDNRYMPERIPWFTSPDWMNYGGIFRSVYLKLTSPVCIDDFKITNKIKFKNNDNNDYNNYNNYNDNNQIQDSKNNPENDEIQYAETAELVVRFFIRDFRPTRRPFSGSIIVTAQSNGEFESTEVPFSLDEQGQDFVRVSLTVPNARLWSPEDPFLYNITFQLLDKNRKQFDRESIRWGFRTFEIKNGQFYLNNKPYIIKGINHHEDHPEVGNSLSPRLIYNDLNIMKDAHINCIRTSHYPPYEALLALADEMGFLVIEELPLWHMEEEQFNEKYLSKASQQLWEMIHRDKNHCSVIAWCLGQSCRTDTLAGKEFFKSLIEITKDQDPFRLVTYVSPDVKNDLGLHLIDFISINLFTGWYSSYKVSPKSVGPELESINRFIESKEELKEKPLVVAEFGAEAIAGFKAFSQAHWSENYQYNLLETYLKQFQEKKYIKGAIVWHFQDFRCSPYGGFQYRPKEYNNKGIVDMHRNPKISYFILQQLFKKWKP